MNFCTLFLKTENVHLMKDVGQIPYCLKENFGYHAYIATYENGEYPYLLNEVENLELQFVRKSRLGPIFDGIRYLYKNRKNIDVLNLYHLNLSSFFWIVFFNIVRKKNAIVYLKLDANHLEIDKMRQKSIKAWIKHITIRNADIVSAESNIIRDTLQQYCKSEILYIPNGYLMASESSEPPVKKENIILTVGRLGTYEKATEVLVDAFIQSNIAPEWQLALVGPMTDEFRVWLDNIYAEYPDLSKSILMPGSINDKKTLQGWYQKAKAFVLPSRYESFGIVLVEAMLNGCFVITSDTVLAARDLIQNDAMGRIVKVDSEQQLGQALHGIAQMEIDWDANAKQIQNSMEDKFLWKNILQVLDCRIRDCMEGYECKNQK